MEAILLTKYSLRQETFYTEEKYIKTILYLLKLLEIPVLIQNQRSELLQEDYGLQIARIIQ
jgi:hypothetical protein